MSTLDLRDRTAVAAGPLRETAVGGELSRSLPACGLARRRCLLGHGEKNRCVFFPSHFPSQRSFLASFFSSSWLYRTLKTRKRGRVFTNLVLRCSMIQKRNSIHAHLFLVLLNLDQSIITEKIMNSVLRATLLALALLAAPLGSLAQIGDGNDPSEFREFLSFFYVDGNKATGIDWMLRESLKESPTGRESARDITATTLFSLSLLSFSLSLAPCLVSSRASLSAALLDRQREE